MTTDWPIYIDFVLTFVHRSNFNDPMNLEMRIRRRVHIFQLYIGCFYVSRGTILENGYRVCQVRGSYDKNAPNLKNYLILEMSSFLTVWPDFRIMSSFFFPAQSLLRLLLPLFLRRSTFLFIFSCNFNSLPLKVCLRLQSYLRFSGSFTVWHD